jgi:hypothetical protein
MAVYNFFMFSETLGVKCVSVVADNENANRGLFKILDEWRPHLLNIGCSAHGFQLVMKDLFEKIPLVRCAP